MKKLSINLQRNKLNLYSIKGAYLTEKRKRKMMIRALVLACMPLLGHSYAPNRDPGYKPTEIPEPVSGPALPVYTTYPSDYQDGYLARMPTENSFDFPSMESS